MHIYFHIVFLFLASLSVAISSAQDITLMDYYMSECSSDHNSYKEIDRVSEINHKDFGVTEITLSVQGNCSMMDSISVSRRLDSIFFTYNYPVITTDYIPILQEDSSYVIMEVSSYDMAECNCCFTFNLEISGLEENSNYKFIANGDEVQVTAHRFPLKPISFEILNGDTINYSDIYGFRQGRWVHGFSRFPVIEDAFYIDDQILYGNIWKHYDENKNLISEERWENGKHVADLFYYPSGNLKRRCLRLGTKECEDFPDEP